MKRTTTLFRKTGLALLMFLAVNQVFAQLSCYQIIGYFPSWVGAASAIDYSKYTHINYAFGLPNTNGTVGAIDNASKLTDLVSRAHSNGVKVLLSIGGWMSSSPSGTPFESIAANSSYITQFSNSCASLITQYGLDGIDIDWEYPTSTTRWNALMTPLATKVHSMGKLLTAAVPSSSYYGGMVGTISFLDFVNIMSYDCGCPTTAPYSQAVDALNYWAGRGVTQSKRILGVPFYSEDNYTSLHVQKANLVKTNGGGIMIWDIATYYGDITSIYNTLGSVCGKGTPPPPPPPTCNTVNIPGTIQAESYCSMSGIQTETTSDAGGGQDVGWIEANDWIAYKINVPSTGSYTVQYRVSSLSGGGSIRLEKLGGGTSFGTISVPSTGGWQTWTTISQSVSLTAGTQDIAIVAAAGGFNINWFSISGGTPPPPPPSGIPYGSYITLKGSNGMFVSGENGTTAMYCNRTTAQAWEKFLVVDAGGGLVALQAGSNGLYVTGSSPMYATSTSIGAAQKFSWISPASGQVQLKCSSNSLFVSSENGTAAMNCNRTTAQGWETFTWATSTKSTSDDITGAIAADIITLKSTLVQDQLELENNLDSPFDLKIFDLSGRLLIQTVAKSGYNMVNVSSLKSGIYIIQVANSSNSKALKFVKE